MKRVVIAAAALIVAASPSIAAGPSLADGILARAETARAAGDHAAAVKLMQSAIVADPKRGETYLRLAEIYAEAGDTLLAGKYYALALEIDPEMLPAIAGMGLVDLAVGDHAAASARLARLDQLCARECPERQKLARALTAQVTGIDMPEAGPARLDKN